MRRSVSAIAARTNLGELLESVYYRGDEVVVERSGRPMAVLIPMAEYERIEQRRAELRRRLDAHWASMGPIADGDELEQVILEELAAMRQERRGVAA